MSRPLHGTKKRKCGFWTANALRTLRPDFFHELRFRGHLVVHPLMPARAAALLSSQPRARLSACSSPPPVTSRPRHSLTFFRAASYKLVRTNPSSFCQFVVAIHRQKASSPVASNNHLPFMDAIWIKCALIIFQSKKAVSLVGSETLPARSSNSQVFLIIRRDRFADCPLPAAVSFRRNCSHFHGR